MMVPRIGRHLGIWLFSITATFALSASADVRRLDEGPCVSGSSTGYETGLGVPYVAPEGQAIGFQIVAINAPISRVVGHAPFDNRTFYDRTPKVGDSIAIPGNIGGNLLVKVFTSDGAGHGGAVCFKAQFAKR